MPPSGGMGRSASQRSAYANQSPLHHPGLGKQVRRPGAKKGSKIRQRSEKLTILQDFASTFGESLAHCQSLDEVGVKQYEDVLRAAGEEPGKGRKDSDEKSRLLHLKRRAFELVAERDNMLAGAPSCLAAIWKAAAQGRKPAIGFARIMAEGGRFGVVLRSTAPSVEEIRSLHNDADQVSLSTISSSSPLPSSSPTPPPQSGLRQHFVKSGGHP